MQHEAQLRAERIGRDSDRTAAAAARLRRARTTRVPCDPVRDLIGPDDMRSAYDVQQILVAERTVQGARVSGRKIGLTSLAVQQQLQVDQPDFGVLFEDMRCDQSEPIDIDRLLQPRIEAEVAFVLGADIDDQDATAESVRSAVRSVVGALEIVDSRIRDWDISFGDTVADNGSSGLYVLGDELRTLDEIDPAEVEMQMTINGDLVSTGAGTDCLGDPLNALAWLARTAAGLGQHLRAGDVILSGALGPMAPVTSGARVEATITGLGIVRANFTERG